jgi:hypothetical protein
MSVMSKFFVAEIRAFDIFWSWNTKIYRVESHYFLAYPLKRGSIQIPPYSLW